MTTKNALAAAIGALSILVFLGVAANATATSKPEVSQTLWLIVGVICLLLVLFAFGVVSRIDTKASRKHGPLGLPDGSVGAVLALLLLLFFSLSSSFLYAQIHKSESTGHESIGITADMVARLPENRILKIEIDQPGQPDGSGRTYKVTLAPETSESIDFARSVQTTVGTLLVAIIGFYFGHRAVEAGAQAARADKPPSDGEAHGAGGTDESKPDRPKA